eukprot:jgi/Mesen1/5414/ME000269S04561
MTSSFPQPQGGSETALLAHDAMPVTHRWSESQFLAKGEGHLLPWVLSASGTGTAGAGTGAAMATAAQEPARGSFDRTQSVAGGSVALSPRRNSHEFQIPSQIATQGHNQNQNQSQNRRPHPHHPHSHPRQSEKSNSALERTSSTSSQGATGVSPLAPSLDPRGVSDSRQAHGGRGGSGGGGGGFDADGNGSRGGGRGEFDQAVRKAMALLRRSAACVCAYEEARHGIATSGHPPFANLAVLMAMLSRDSSGSGGGAKGGTSLASDQGGGGTGGSLWSNAGEEGAPLLTPDGAFVLRQLDGGAAAHSHGFGSPQVAASRGGAPSRGATRERRPAAHRRVKDYSGGSGDAAGAGDDEWVDLAAERFAPPPSSRDEDIANWTRAMLIDVRK